MNSYFSHDSNARNDDKILNVRMKYGMEGYGIYFGIIERMREEQDYTSKRDYNAIGFDFHVDASKIKDIVENFGLFSFTEDGECFYSDSLNDRMAHMDHRKAKQSEAGKKGAAKRWNGKAMATPSNKNGDPITTPSKNDGNPMATPSYFDGNKIKLNKTKSNKTKTKDNASVGRAHGLNAFGKWQELWGFPNAIAQKDLFDWSDEFGDDLVCWAIDYAGRRDVQKKGADGYLMRMMDRYREQGIKTVEQAEAEAKQHAEIAQANSPRTHSYGKPARVEAKPDWLDKPYQPSDKPEDQTKAEEIAAKLAKLKEMRQKNADT